MSYSDLPLDAYDNIYSFLKNEDLNPILRCCRETYQVASKHLQSHIDDNRAMLTSAKNGYTDAVRSLFLYINRANY